MVEMVIMVKIVIMVSQGKVPYISPKTTKIEIHEINAFKTKVGECFNSKSCLKILIWAPKTWIGQKDGHFWQ